MTQIESESPQEVKLYTLDRGDHFTLNNETFKFFKIDGLYAQVTCLSNKRLEEELKLACGGVVLLDCISLVRKVTPPSQSAF